MGRKHSEESILKMVAAAKLCWERRRIAHPKPPKAKYKKPKPEPEPETKRELEDLKIGVFNQQKREFTKQYLAGNDAPQPGGYFDDPGDKITKSLLARLEKLASPPPPPSASKKK